MSSNQPTDEKLGTASDKAADKPTGINAHTAGMLDRYALKLVHGHHLHKSHHHLHHVELHDDSKDAKVDTTTKPAEPHKVKEGESLSQIAKEAIGTNATRKEIYDLVDKIVQANKDNGAVKNRDLISANGILTIPEHISHDAGSQPGPRSPEGRTAPKTGHETAAPRVDAPQGQPRPVDTRPAAPGPVVPGDGKPVIAKPVQPVRPGDPQPVPPKGDSTVQTNPAGQKPADTAQADAKAKEIEADVQALHKATGQENKIWRVADAKAMTDILQGKTDADRAAIAAQYKTDFGVSLDDQASKVLNGSDLEKFRNTLNRQDSNAASENAQRIHEDLTEMKNTSAGRSKTEIEKDIRDTLSSHNSDQIKSMEAEYAKAYPGQNLHDALMSDPTLSQTTKDMANVYLKHDEKNADQETKQLVDIALKSKDVETFNEVMKNATADQRADFLKNGGEQKINDAFGHWYSNSDAQHALDYAKEGKLDAATQVADNTHLLNNTKGIELAITKMTPDERSMYQNGKSLEAGKTVPNLSSDDATKAKAYYDKLYTAMTNASGATDVAKWEDQIATGGKGSFVSSLTADSHWYGNAGNDTIQQQVRSMSASDWQDCKQNPGRRDEMVTMLGTLGKSQDEINQTMAVYDKMMSADAYDHASDQSKKSVLQSLDENKHWYGNNRDGVLDSIKNMSQADQDSYKNNPDFRKKVDDAVKGSIEDLDGQDAAKRMLDAVANGKSPKSDSIANLERLQNYDGSKTTEAVKLVEKALKDDPTLKDNPQFKQAVQDAFGDDYDNFGKPFVETGTLPLEMKMHLSQGVFSNDNNQIYSDIASATPAERQRLQTDSAYRDQVIGFLSKDRQAVALAVASQGEQKPEDKIRDAAVGMGGSSDIVDTLKSIKPEDLDRVKQDYATKYGSSLEGDLANKLSGTDRTEAERVFAQNLSVETKVNIARDQTENTRSGVGAAISDNVWRSGTGAQADNAEDQTIAALTEKNKMDKAIADGTGVAAGMSPEQQQALQAKLTANINDAISTQKEATDNHAEAKAAAAEYVSDGAIAAVAIGSMIVTGGADVPLVLALAAAGGAIKVGTNATLEGNDYDWSVGHVAEDAGIGAVTAATSVIGPGEVAAVFGIGKQAAEESAAVAIESLGASALRTGGEKIVQDGTKDIVREALASGAKKLDAKAFTELAEKAIAPEVTGAARQEAVAKLSSTLESEVSSRMAQGVVRRATQQGLNMAGGGLGGGAGGLAQGSTQWDSRLSLSANLGHTLQSGLEGTISGAIGGGAMTAGMEGLGTTFRAAKGALSRESNVVVEDVAKNTDLVLTETAENALDRTGAVAETAEKEPTLKTNKGGRVTEVKTEEGRTSIDYFKGDKEGEVKSVKMADGTKYASKDGDNWTVTTSDGKANVKGRVSVSEDGVVSFKAESGAKTTYNLDGSEVRVDEAGNTGFVQKDGKLSSVTNVKGKVALFDYAADGQLAKVQRSDGSTLERIGDFSNNSKEQWLLKDMANPDGRIVEGQKTLSPEGTIEIKNAKGSEDFNPDGSRIVKDADNRVLKTADRNGAETTFTYDAAGKLNRVDSHDFSSRRLPAVQTDAEGRVRSVTSPPWGSEIQINYANGVNGEVEQTVTMGNKMYSSADGKNWKLSSVDEPTAVSDWKGQIKVAKDGTVTIKEDGTTKSTAYRPDGVTVRYDGHKIESIAGGLDNYKSLGDGKWERSLGDPLEGTIKETPEGLFFQPKGRAKPSEISNKETWQVAKIDGSKSDTSGPITVDEKGRMTIPRGWYNETRELDTSLMYRDAKDNTILSGRDAVGNLVKKDQPVVRDDFHQSVHDRFDQLNTTERVTSAVDKVKAELGDVRAIGADGKETSVLDSLIKDTTLNDQQKANVLRNLAEVREHFASYRAGDRMHPDPEVNWIHTQGELGRVLESARANKLTASQTEDAMLASMYSDSVKFAFPPPKDASANFFTHHLDGAKAAEEALTKQGYPKERIDSIVQAIKEHQISPPEFMGSLYYTRMKGAIDGLEAGNKLPPEKIAQLRSTLEGMSEQVGEKRMISGIAHVNDVPKVQGADGKFEVAFTKDQKEVLKLAGVDKWSVPTDPAELKGFKQLPKAEQDKLISTYKISQTLIDGDAIDNYATLGGASKIVALRRPGSMFQDETVWKSIASVDDSFKDAHNVLSAEGKRVADQSLAARNRVLNDETTGIKAQMDTWLKSKGLDPAKDKIPFYNADLKYPKTLTAEEKAVLAAGTKADGSPLTQAERTALEFKGLNAKQIEQFKTAQEITDHMRDLLRQSNRLDGTLPGNFEPGSVKLADGEWALTKPTKFEAPETTDTKLNANGSRQATTADGRSVSVAKDGSTTITDTANATSRTYDKDGQILRAVDGDNQRSFIYDKQGKLTDIKYKDGTIVYTNDGENWMRSKVGDASAPVEPIHTGKVEVDADGSVKYISADESKMQIERGDGSVEEHLRTGRVDWIKADLPTETAKFNELAEKNFTNPKQLERVQKLLSEFDKEAETRGFDANKKALFLKQINRLMADDPNAVIPQAQRAALAEQVMNHAVHPTSVDQGTNSTCNVTTLEVRNYVRNPEKNAQNLADIATTGKYITPDGKTIDLSELQGGIHPDGEARKNLKLQAIGSELIKKDGSRDFASQITELSMVNAKWQGESHIVLNNTDQMPWNLAYDREHNLIGGINDRSKITKLYSQDHKELSSLGPNDTAYTRSGKPITDLDRSKLVYNKSGWLNGTTDDANLTKVFDAAGGKLKDLDEGVHGYDANGKEVLRVTKPGEIAYDKQINGVTEKERVMIKDGDKWTPLKEPGEGVIDAPRVYVHDLESINKAVTNVSDHGYMIDRTTAPTMEALENQLKNLKENNGFPAVLGVYTSRRPFSSTYGIETAWAGGGYHVVDIHDYDPVTKMVKFSNQWGSRWDNMDKGVSLASVYKGMEQTKLSQYLEDHKILRGFYRTGIAAAGGAALLGGTVYGENAIFRASTPTAPYATPQFAPTPYQNPYQGRTDAPALTDAPAQPDDAPAPRTTSN